MNEPRRWLDEGAPEVIGRMLRAAGDERPSSDAVERAVAGLAVGAGITGSAGAAAGATAKGTTLASGVFLKWTLLGSLVTLGAGGLAVGLSSPSNPQVAMPAGVASSAPVARPQTSVADLQPPEEPSVPDSVDAKRATPAASTGLGSELRPQASSPKSAQAPAEEVPVVDVELLARETRLVDRARADLAAGRAGSALAILDEYQAQFPQPRYAPEALYLRMEGLLAQGNTQAARQVAKRLAQSHPNSPHAARAEALLTTTIP